MSLAKLEKILLTLIKAGIYLTLLVPFIYIDSTYFPFIVGKVVVFQIIVEALLVFYVGLILINPAYLPRKSALFLAIVIYLAALFMSTAFGIDPSRSFWANFERMTGFFALLHFFVFFVLVSGVFQGWREVKALLGIAVFFSVIEGVIVFAQSAFGSGIYLNQVTGRVWGSLGNSIYVGGYFLFHIFFAGLLAFKDPVPGFLSLPLNAKGKRGELWIWRIFYLLIAAFLAFVMIYSQSSRGVTLALIISIFFLLFLYGLFTPLDNKRLAGRVRKVFIAALVLFCILGGVLFLFREERWVERIPVIGSIFSISLSGGTAETRLIAWEIALKAWRDRPILGWGPENFYYAFNQHYNPKSLEFSYYETWFDRSHNAVLDALSTFGAIGLLAYLAVFTALGAVLVRAFRKKIIDHHILFFGLVIFLSYFLQNLFVFDNPSSYLLFFLSLGIAGSLSYPRLSVRHPKSSAQHFSPGAVSFIVAIFSIGALILIYTNTKTFKAARAVLNSERVIVRNLEAGLGVYQKALKIKTPYKDDIQASLVKRVIQHANGPLNKSETFKQALLYAKKEAEDMVSSHPKDIHNYLLLGQLNTILGTFDIEYLREADRVFAAGIKYSPRRQQVFYSWAKTRLAGGDFAGAIELLEEARDLDPAISDSYWYLGLIYNSAGDKEKAVEQIDKARELGYIWKSIYEILLTANLFEELERYEDLPAIYEEALVQAPDSSELYLRLAKVYDRLGQKEKAAEAAKEAVRLNPGLRETIDN